MHIILVSESQKKAIVKVNALLDSYATRIGQQTWATPITEEGLHEIYVALRRQATRQTAVACYRNDGRQSMKLLWIVGSKSTFSLQGAFSVHTVKKLTLQKNNAPVWQRILALSAELAGLVHDYGKYSKHFQQKLRNPQKEMDSVRHEWLSVCLLRALYSENVGENAFSWEDAWKRLNIHEEYVFKHETFPQRSVSVNTAWEALEYLVASHHRLFNDDNFFPTVISSHVRDKHIADTYTTPFATPSERHYQSVATLIKRFTTLVAQQGENTHSYWWALLLLARVALIFADHTVSAQKYTKETFLKDGEAVANTQNGKLNQPLQWHLEM